MNFKLKTAPTEEPATLAEAKLHLKVENTADDTLISDLISSARELCEKETGRAFITQTWQLFLDRFPFAPNGDEWWDGTRDGAITNLYEAVRHIAIPKPPLVSVSHLITYGDDPDNNDDPQTFDASNYFVDTVSEPGRLALRINSIWPVRVLRAANGIEVEFVAGYGAAAAVPRDIKNAILITVAHLYENRGDQDMNLPNSAQALLSKYRIARL